MSNKGGQHPSKPISVPAYGPHWATHLPILAKVLAASNGPVLELGIGIFSTPLLHSWCDAEKRFLDSYENDERWTHRHEHWMTPLHHITYVKNWDDVPIEKRHWGVVFVDHSGHRREVDAIRAAQYADYVVLHDTNGRYDPEYHYSKAYPYFKYKYIFDKIYPHTTVVSNFYDVKNIWMT